MEGLGHQLSAARTARNLSIDEVAARIHMRPEYIAALEEERWNDIGDPLYVRGFLRTYAHFLELSAERFITEYRTKAPEGIRLLGAQTPEEVERSVKRAGSFSMAIFAGVACAVVLGGGVTAFVLRSGSAAPTVAAQAQAPMVTGTPSLPSQSSAPSTVASPQVADLSPVPAVGSPVPEVVGSPVTPLPSATIAAVHSSPTPAILVTPTPMLRISPSPRVTQQVSVNRSAQPISPAMRSSQSVTPRTTPAVRKAAAATARPVGQSTIRRVNLPPITTSPPAASVPSAAPDSGGAAIPAGIGTAAEGLKDALPAHMRRRSAGDFE